MPLLVGAAGGPLDSPYLRAKASSIMKGDFSPSFTAEMAAKDGRLIVEAASLAGIQVDVAAAAAERLIPRDRGAAA